MYLYDPEEKINHEISLVKLHDETTTCMWDAIIVTTENYHPTLQSPSVGNTFWFYGLHLYCSDSVSLLSLTSFPAAVFSKKALINGQYARSIQHQTFPSGVVGDQKQG